MLEKALLFNGKSSLPREISSAKLPYLMVLSYLLTKQGAEDEHNFVPLYPLDKSADNTGLFPCGLESGAVEMKTVNMPKNLKCNNCILQLSWRTSSDVYYTCSDVVYPSGIFVYDKDSQSIFYLYLIVWDDPLWLLYSLFLCGGVGAFAVGSHLYNLLKNPATEKEEPEVVEFTRRRPVPAEEPREELKEEEPMIVEPEVTAVPEVTPAQESEEVKAVEEVISTPQKPPPIETENITEFAPRLEPEVKSPDANAKPRDSISPGSSGAMEKAFMKFIQKIMESNQIEEAEGFRELQPSGKVSWTKTNFIFALDCSGSMKGPRWNSVMVGFNTCLKRIKQMKDVYVSAFTFDDKTDVLCVEKTPIEAAGVSGHVAFTGRGTDYTRALDNIIEIAKNSKYPDNLVCIIFLSDGLGGYPEEGIKELKKLRNQGKKILFYTIACVTDEEEDMIKMSEELQGEHYKVTDPNGAKLVFATILTV